MPVKVLTFKTIRRVMVAYVQTGMTKKKQQNVLNYAWKESCKTL